MANLKKRRTSLVNGILGHDAAPRNVVLSGMAELEKTLDQHFRKLQKQRAQRARSSAPLRNKLLRLLGRDPAQAELIRNLRASRKRPSRHVAPPRAVQQKERVFLGSLGGTRTAPSDYPWTWKATSGSPTVITKAALNPGFMGLSIDTGDDSASASARAAVGIYFSSPIDCVSNFRFWASPSLAFDWHEYCSLDSADSDGFIGLYAASYDWAGNPTGTLVDQMISLWSNKSWWNDASGGGSNKAFSLSADFEVDSDHWYALWVWCGMDDSGDGFGIFSGSSASSELSVWLPAISWEVG